VYILRAFYGSKSAIEALIRGFNGDLNRILLKEIEYQPDTPSTLDVTRALRFELDATLGGLHLV
jgi:hypothetical protein